MKLFIKKILVGMSICFIIYCIIFPFMIIAELISTRFGWFFVLLFFLMSFLIGEISLHSKVPFLSLASKIFLSSLSKIYNNFLIQAAKYFCEENRTAPFSKIVKVNFSKEIQALGMVSNETTMKKVVFIPTSPNPTSGFLLIVPNQYISETDFTPEEIMKYTLTCGAFKLPDSYFE